MQFACWTATRHILFAEAFGDAWNDILRRLFDGTLSLVLHDAKAAVRRCCSAAWTRRASCLTLPLCGVPARPDPVRLRPATACARVLQMPSCRSWIWTIRRRFRCSAVRRTPKAVAQHAGCAAPFYARAADRIEQLGMRKLYYEIRAAAPARVLAEMEAAGCAVEPDELRAFGDKLDVRIRDLTEQIYPDADGEFNINSPKQLGEVLFEKLGLHAPKKTKQAIPPTLRCLSVSRRTTDRAAHPRVPQS